MFFSPRFHKHHQWLQQTCKIQQSEVSATRQNTILSSLWNCLQICLRDKLLTMSFSSLIFTVTTVFIKCEYDPLCHCISGTAACRSWDNASSSENVGKGAASSILTETSILTYPSSTGEADLLSTGMLCIQASSPKGFKLRNKAMFYSNNIFDYKLLNRENQGRQNIHRKGLLTALTYCTVQITDFSHPNDFLACLKLCVLQSLESTVITLEACDHSLRLVNTQLPSVPASPVSWTLFPEQEIVLHPITNEKIN